MTNLEKAEQALRDAGFDEPFDDGLWTRHREDPRIKATLMVYWHSPEQTLEAELSELPLTELPNLIATCSHGVHSITAPALVQTLVDALMAWEKAEDHHDNTCEDCKQDDWCEEGANLYEQAQISRRATLTAVEQANLPHMYSIEDVRQAMDWVYNEIPRPWNKGELSAVAAAFHALAERLER